MKLYKYFNISICFVLIGLLLCCACNNNERKINDYTNKTIDIKKPLEEANKHLNKIEETEIEDYIKRYSWKMNKTITGLRYMIYKKSDSNIKAETGSVVKINYSLHLINGDFCYSSDINGPKIFEPGKGQVENGLEEGIFLLNKGDKAKFIIPSHLGFGLLGDQNKIPKKATLIYDVELLDIK